MRRSVAFVLAALVLAPVFMAPVASAQTQARVDGVFEARNDAAVPYDILINWANVSDQNLTSFNVTWNPFFENHTELQGITVTPVTPPSIIRPAAGNVTDTIRVVQRIRFTAQEILDGASVSWWRLPVGNISDNDDVTVRIYRSDSSQNNVSSIGSAAPVFTDTSQTHLVWERATTTGVSNEPPYLLLRQSIPAPGGLVDYNFTYVKVFAPIVPTKDYFLYVQVDSPDAIIYNLFYTNGDIGNDGLYGSFIRYSTTTAFMPADLDVSLVIVRGMANGIGGLNLNCDTYTNATCDTYMRVSFTRILPFGGHLITADTYFNMVQPVYTTNTSTGVDAILNVTVFVSGPPFFHTFGPFDIDWNDTMYAFVLSIHVGAIGGLVGTTALSARMNWDIVNDTGSYYLSSSAEGEEVLVETSEPAFGMASYDIHYAIFGYFSMDEFFYENTKRSIIFLGIGEPSSDIEKLQAWQRWQSLLKVTEDVCNLAVTFSYLGFLLPGASQVGSTLTDLVQHEVCAVRRILDGLFWTAISTFRNLALFFNPSVQWLFSAGSWIHQLVSFLVDVLQLLMDLTIRFFSIFIIGVVYVILFASVHSVSRGFYVWVRNGYDYAAMRAELERGWARVWPIIQLLISLATFAIAAISAVIPL